MSTYSYIVCIAAQHTFALVKIEFPPITLNTVRICTSVFSAASSFILIYLSHLIYVLPRDDDSRDAKEFPSLPAQTATSALLLLLHTQQKKNHPAG